MMHTANALEGRAGLLSGIVAIGALVVAMTACGSADSAGPAASDTADTVPPTTTETPIITTPDPGPSTPSDAGPAEPPEPPPYETTAEVECQPIKSGSNKLKVNGKEREFLVTLPADTSNIALLFQWHGFLQKSQEFSDTIVYDPPAGAWKAFDPNAFHMPLATITPVDRGLIPVWGLDWDIVSGEKDAPYFEAMLKCMDTQFNVDRRRVYSFGFSAGAVFTNLLAAKYPKLFAATISESGAWFNDKAEWSEIRFPGVGSAFMKWKWEPLDRATGGAVLMTHGGPNDFATIISLENSAIKALPFLKAGGQDVTECTHEFGHTLEPDLTQQMIYDYMWAHQLGALRPEGLTAGFPTAEQPLFNTRCYFHPGD